MKDSTHCLSDSDRGMVGENYYFILKCLYFHDFFSNCIEAGAAIHKLSILWKVYIFLHNE